MGNMVTLMPVKVAVSTRYVVVVAGSDNTDPVEGIHQPMNVLLQSRQVACAPSMVMSRCRHFLQWAHRRPDLSETSCPQVAINSHLSAAEKFPCCKSAEMTVPSC